VSHALSFLSSHRSEKGVGRTTAARLVFDARHTNLQHRCPESESL
jgi:hypothetical protein